MQYFVHCYAGLSGGRHVEKWWVGGGSIMRERGAVGWMGNATPFLKPSLSKVRFPCFLVDNELENAEEFKHRSNLIVFKFSPV